MKKKMMKTALSVSMFTVLSIVSLLFIAFFASTDRNYQTYINETKTLYDSRGLHGFYDQHFSPFGISLGVGLALMGSWIALIYFYSKKKVLGIIGIIILLSAFPTVDGYFMMDDGGGSSYYSSLLNWTEPPIPPAWNDTNRMRIVDVLCCVDEEFMEDPRRMDNVEEQVYLANTYVGAQSNECFEDMNISFQVRGWIEFDSLDARPYYLSAAYMLEEAVTETNFHNGMNYEGYVIDLLFIITGQEIDMIGVSIPWFHAMIMELCKTQNDADFIYIRHEASHQLWCAHCENYCCMNPGNFFMPMGWSWCDYCEQWLLEHKYIIL